jgi:ankyrin repeat protein
MIMRVLALIVPAALLCASVASVHGAATTSTASISTRKSSPINVPEKFFNEKSKIPAFLMAACRDGKDIIIEHFLHSYPGYARDSNTRLPSSGESCLHLAARNGHASVIETMLDAGADVNIQTHLNEYGAPPLYYAVRHGQLHAVKVLIRSGANVNLVFESPGEDNKGKMTTCYDTIMEMIERMGVDRETAKASEDEDYYRIKDQLEKEGAKHYEQLDVATATGNNEQSEQVKSEL